MKLAGVCHVDVGANACKMGAVVYLKQVLLERACVGV